MIQCSCDTTTTQVFTVEVTEDFLDYLEYGTLSVEVYGHRRTGFTSNEPSGVVEDGQHKSFPERSFVLLLATIVCYGKASAISDCNVLQML